MPRARAACVVVLCLAGAQPAAGQGGTRSFSDVVAPAIIGQSVGRSLASSVDGFGDLVESTSQLSTLIDQARARFWAEYPRGPGYADAARRFDALLSQKDLLYAYYALMQGPGAALFTTLGAVDGGIPAPAEDVFGQWIGALREGLSGAHTLSAFISRVPDAIQASQQEYTAYRQARDWSEFLRAGRDPFWVNGPDTYLLMLLMRDRGLDRDRAIKAYASWTNALGVPPLLQAVSVVMAAPKEKDGTLADIGRLGLTREMLPPGQQQTPQLAILAESPVPTGTRLVGSQTPLRVIAALVAGGSPQSYVLTLLNGRLDADRWQAAQEAYARLAAAFGQRQLDSVATAIRDAPRRHDGDFVNRGGLGITPLAQGPAGALAEVLSIADPLGEVRYALATERSLATPAAIDAAFRAVKDQYGEANLREAVATLRKERSFNLNASGEFTLLRSLLEWREATAHR